MWAITGWEPSTWRGAVLETVVTTCVMLALWGWLGWFPENEAGFMLWWVPLWMALSLTGFAYRRRRRRRATARPPYDAYRGGPAGG
ncbi:hypothetical protein GCM10027517_22810 [Phycicoccus ginsengisoli]